jgi:hypothetical protein
MTTRRKKGVGSRYIMGNFGGGKPDEENGRGMSLHLEGGWWPITRRVRMMVSRQPRWHKSERKKVGMRHERKAGRIHIAGCSP